MSLDFRYPAIHFDLYGLVLITNYREFRLIGEDAGGNPTELDRYTIADDEAAFWNMTTHPGRLPMHMLFTSMNSCGA